MFQVIAVYPPKKAGKVVCRAQVVLTQPSYMKAEDYNKETDKSYMQAEGMCSAGFKFSVSIITDSAGQPMCVGTILPPFDIGRSIANEALKLLGQRDAA